MKKLTTLIIILSVRIITANGQCTVNYSYSGTTDTLTFTNLSSVSHAHYYWNFGDGSSSYATNPVHVFPESGEYLVTLYGLDSVSTCHTYYETWITVTKPTTDTCNALITDSIFYNVGGDTFGIYDLSQNCGGYYSNVDGANFQNSPPGCCHQLPVAWSSALWLNRIQFYSITNGYNVHREYYRTMPWHFSSNLNYDSCSANFEYEVVYQTNGAWVTFTAMNKNATTYQWELIGFGNPIYDSLPSAFQYYPYLGNDKYEMWLVVLRTEDANGCGDTVTQTILIHDINYGTTSINEYENFSFSIKPNPATDRLNIDFGNFNSNHNLRIFNMLGKLELTKSMNNKNGTIDISDLSSGFHILEVAAGNKISRQKFMKQ